MAPQKKLLLVDDSPSIRSILRVYLMNGGFEFLEADTAEKGMALLKVTPVDLIILDVNMPGMDGITFVQKMRADATPHVKSAKVLLLTGSSSDEFRTKGLQAGANGFLGKPVDRAKLNELVNAMLTGASA
ncbi:MAG: response regulator [Myxococcaceae bacterium]